MKSSGARGCLILVFTGLVLGSSACSNFSERAAEKYIKESESQWAESVATSDTSVLERILADDFIWVYQDGKRFLWNRADTIADAAAGPGDFISNHVDEVRVRFFGSTAIAQGSESWVRKSKDGRLIKGRFLWTDVWLRRHGRWQIVQAQDEAIGPRADAPAGAQKE